MDPSVEIPETQLEEELPSVSSVPQPSDQDLHDRIKKLESSYVDMIHSNIFLRNSIEVLQAENKLLHSEIKRLSTKVNSLELQFGQTHPFLSSLSRQHSAAVLSESRVGNIPSDAPSGRIVAVVESSQPQSSPFTNRENVPLWNKATDEFPSTASFSIPPMTNYLQKPKKTDNRPLATDDDYETSGEETTPHRISPPRRSSPFKTPLPFSASLQENGKSPGASRFAAPAEEEPKPVNEEFNDDWGLDDDLNLDPDVEGDFWGEMDQNIHEDPDIPPVAAQNAQTFFASATTYHSTNLQKPPNLLHKPISRPSIELTPSSAISTFSFASTSSSAFQTPTTSRYLEKPKQINGRPSIYEERDFNASVVTPMASSFLQKPQPSQALSPFVSSSQACVAKFKGDFQDDGSTGRFDGHKFPHSAKLQDTFKKTFGLHQFRKNQLQAINAALLVEDCFILMPTGGGKSLCYQLPALCLAGVTIVISPLRSLIQDQVQHLQFLNINARALSSDVPVDEQNAIFRDIQSMDPQIKLLYVTPEKVSASEKLKSAIKSMYDNGRLNRFVIDEAHCVSQWGHDFRPDYKQLSSLRKTYRDVPMMALTATANPRVRGDILTQLGMRNPKWFMQSFNRTNLKYELRAKKSKNSQQELIDIISSEFQNQCGIIYCLSKQDCDDVAKALQNADIDAVPYHAGLGDDKRSETQKQWTRNKVKIVCATIAFGMGIDKPDVRFVIHYSLPKSIEGYYQETGRAGRDGKPATCILFYSYYDAQRNFKLIMRDDNNGTAQTRSVHQENLKRVVQFCENKSDCRRAMLLEYFGEVFDRNLCKKDPRFVCDNCQSEDKFEAKDVTEEARAVIKNLKSYGVGSNRKNMTLIQLGDILKGSKNAKTKQFEDFDIYGMAASRFSRTDLDSFVRKLVMDEVLEEEVVTLKLRTGNTVCCYIKMGKKADMLLAGRLNMVIHTEKMGGKKKVAMQNNITALEKVEEDCYLELTEWLRGLAEGMKPPVRPTAIFSMQTLADIARELPDNDEVLCLIDGVTEGKISITRATLMPILKKYRQRRQQLRAEQEAEAAEKSRKSTAKKAKKVAAASPAKKTTKPAQRALESSDEEERHADDNSIICIEDSDEENVEEGTDTFASPYFVSTKPAGGGKKRPSPSSAGGTAKKRFRGGKSTNAAFKKKGRKPKAAKGTTNGWRERPKKTTASNGDSSSFSSNPPIFTGRLEGTLQRKNTASSSFGTNAGNRSSDTMSLLRKPQGAPKVSTYTGISKDWMMPVPK